MDRTVADVFFGRPLIYLKMRILLVRVDFLTSDKMEFTVQSMLVALILFEQFNA